MKQSRAPLGASLVVLSSFFFASYGVWTKLMGDFFGSFTASALRCILVLGLMCGIAIMRRELQKVHWRRDRKWLLTMLASSGLISGPLYYAVLNAGVGISMAVAYVGIVVGMFVFGWLFEGERFTRDKFVATAFGILGLLLIFSPSVKAVGWLALSAALIGGLAAAANMAATKKISYNTSQSVILAWGMGVIANVPIAFLLGEALPDIGWHAEWGYLLLFVLASVVASWTFIQGLKLIEAGAAGILGLLEVVFGVLFGVVFFHERPDLIVLLGVAAIIVAAAIPYIKDYNAKRGSITPSS